MLPGLVDTYGHAGHGLIKGLHHPRYGWPTGPLYFQATTEDWWYAEGLLSALERLKFGVTCGLTVIGGTPARMDSPVFAERQAEALREVGVRGVLSVGPPDPFVSHLSHPWSATIWDEAGRSQVHEFTYADALENSLEVVRRWHRALDDRIRVALHPPYLFGRLAAHPRIPFTYTDDCVPVMREKAEEMRTLADRYGVLIHSHAFVGSVAYAVAKFGAATVREILGTGNVLLAHCNGLAEEEIALLGEARAGISVVPFTHENILYGTCPAIELLRAGAVVTISTDGTAPYTSYDLFKELPRAIWAQWERFKDQSVLPPGKALRMVTIDAARALGMDGLIGSLEPGKRADIILVDLHRPHLTPAALVPRQMVFYATGADVDTVIVDGRVLMRGRQVVTVDENAVLEQARAEAEAAFTRFDVSQFLEMGEEFWLNWRY